MTKNQIVDKYSATITGYGAVCLRVNKESFQADVLKLKQRIEEFRKHVADQLQGEMIANHERLVDALLPAVAAIPRFAGESFSALILLHPRLMNAWWTT